MSRRDLHPTLRRRFNEVVESFFLWGAIIAIWFSVVSAFISALLQDLS